MWLVDVEPNPDAGATRHPVTNRSPPQIGFSVTKASNRRPGLGGLLMDSLGRGLAAPMSSWVSAGGSRNWKRGLVAVEDRIVSRLGRGGTLDPGGVVGLMPTSSRP